MRQKDTEKHYTRETDRQTENITRVRQTDRHIQTEKHYTHETDRERNI